MANDPKNPVEGEFVFDASECAAYAVDLPPGACQGMCRTRAGYAGAVSELLANQAQSGSKAGIPEQDISDLLQANQQIARIDAFLPAMRKVVEMLEETRAMLDDQRERIVLNAAKAVDRRAKKDKSLLAKYQATRTYRSEAAKKGAKTKAKAQKAQEPSQDSAAKPV